MLHNFLFRCVWRIVIISLKSVIKRFFKFVSNILQKIQVNDCLKFAFYIWYLSGSKNDACDEKSKDDDNDDNIDSQEAFAFLEH